MQINVLQYLADTIELHEKKTAIVDRNTSVTFEELDRSAKAIAHKIIEQTNQINSPIPVFLPKTGQQIIVFVAVLCSGNFYVPLDVKSPLKRVKNIINELSPALVITQRSSKDFLLEIGLRDEQLLFIEDTLETSGKTTALIDKQLKRVIDTDPVYTIFTSGSTGIPKGVVISHRGVIDYIDWARECFNVDDQCIIGNQSPYFFDNSTLDIYLMLSTGATLHVIPEELFSFPARLLEYVVEHEINFVFWVPAVLSAIANLDLLDTMRPTKLKQVLFAGEVMQNRHLNYWRKYLPEVRYANLYGPTEITVDCTFYKVEREFEDSEPLPIGVPCRNTDVIILDKKNALAKRGEVGELCVRGTSIAHGYWNDPEKTSSAFVQNPLRKNYPERIYRTGDLVYENDRDEILFVGRKDLQIKHQGYRIELGEIEASISTLEGIKTGCVLYNSDKQEISLFYVSDEDINMVQYRKELMKELPKYMVPTALYRVDEIPLKSNGKTDRKRLEQKYFTPARQK